MLFTLEALDAHHGDALLLHYGPEDDPSLIIVDGGTPGVWGEILRPRLNEILELRGVDAPLDVRMVMVSHIDGDHISGIIDAFRDLRRRIQNGQTLLVDPRVLWHNSFDDIIGNQETGPVASLIRWMTSASGAEIAGLDVPLHSLAIAATVAQGRTLRDLAGQVNVDVNNPFQTGRVEAPRTINLGSDTKLHVLGPSRALLQALEAAWDEKLREIPGLDADAARASVAAFLDNSAANLSSIVALVEQNGRRMLLTGDARGDFVLDSLRDQGLMNAQDRINLDLLKVPHHGSDRNVTTEFFQKVRAKNYVFSGDGTVGGNPDIRTLEFLTAARGAARYDMFFTNRLGKIEDFVADDHGQHNRNYRVFYRDDDYYSTWVDLADPLEF